MGDVSSTPSIVAGPGVANEMALTSLGCSKQVNFLKARNELNKGVQAFSAANYATAAERFEAALEFDPELTDAKAYQAYSYMMQYVPGAESPENRKMAQRAIDGFQEVLEMDAENELAVKSMASLYFNMKEFGQAKEWHRKAIDIALAKEPPDPTAAESYYTIGVIDWTASYEPRLQVRADLGMAPEDPGPIADEEKRTELAAELNPVIQEGMEALEKALELNPDYPDAMAYMNLLLREKADLADSAEAHEQLLAQADEWVQRTLDTKKRLTEESTIDQFTAE